MPIRRILSIFRPPRQIRTRLPPLQRSRTAKTRKCVKGLLFKHCTAPRQSDHRTACAVRGRDLVSMALRNALRRAASAAPWATAAPRSLKRPEAGCRAVCSASSARRLAPITPGAACWKSGRSFAAAAECASPPFRPPSHDPREECRTRATRRGARRETRLGSISATAFSTVSRNGKVLPGRLTVTDGVKTRPVLVTSRPSSRGARRSRRAAQAQARERHAADRCVRSGRAPEIGAERAVNERFRRASFSRFARGWARRFFLGRRASSTRPRHRPARVA